ncbi:hypothetical protein BOTBODRAFT_26584 [Botryobasidium botryosum FD-172 SS1]|uniref:Uncharacterized protein n=1 Tax=Botryobasidium botryosum (strain FD-172 SS1) TaxID=930990 RepID=A0A067MXT6_BOTB1|nr:hypothetical protein BOTBODRAFT_26584 [Botryobasidium botryosum FD-172 SS1]
MKLPAQSLRDASFFLTPLVLSITPTAPGPGGISREGSGAWMCIATVQVRTLFTARAPVHLTSQRTPPLHARGCTLACTPRCPSLCVHENTYA